MNKEKYMTKIDYNKFIEQAMNEDPLIDSIYIDIAKKKYPDVSKTIWEQHSKSNSNRNDGLRTGLIWFVIIGIGLIMLAGIVMILVINTHS